MSKLSLPRTFTGKYPSKRLSKREKRVIETAKNTLARGTDCRFEMPPIGAAVDGAGAAVVTDAVANLMNQDGILFEIKNTATATILTPAWASTGLDIARDLTNNHGLEMTQGITSRAKHAYTVGTDDAVFIEVTTKITDVSGTDQYLIGWRKAEAYQADWNDYDEMAALNVVSGAVYISTILNGAATGNVDTGTTWADSASKTVRVNVAQTGVVSFWVDDVKQTATSHTFDAGEVIVPFLYFLHDTDVAQATLLTSWKCGLIGR